MVRTFGKVHLMDSHPAQGRIGDGAFAPTKDAVEVTFCCDAFTHAQVWACQQIPGVRVWESHRGELYMAVPYNAAVLVSRLLGVGLPEMPPDAWAHSNPINDAAHAIFGAGFGAPGPVVPPLYDRLRDYQQAAVQLFMNPHCGGKLLLGDAMGLGKTLEAIVCALTAPGPKLIMGPKMVRSTWQAEVAKWDPGAPFHYIETIDPAKNHVEQLPPIAETKWLFIHYDLVHAWWSWLRMYRFGACIADEVHTRRNVNTKSGKGVQLAMASIPRRILLTGTPVENRMAELHHLLQLTTGRGTWGPKGAFRIRYAGAQPNPHGGLEDRDPTNVEELRERMRFHYLRRTPKDVSSLSLPPVQRIPVPVPLDAKAQKKLAELFEKADPAALHAMRLFQQTGTLPSAENHQAIKAIGKLRQAVSAHKLEATVATAVAHMEAYADDPRGGQLVIFTWTRATAEKLEKLLQLKAVGDAFSFAWCVTGDLSQAARDRHIHNFRLACARGAPAVLVATYGALGVGVNLQCANGTIQHDMGWVPGELMQAEARVWRGGQDRHVSSYWMIGESTFDEYVIRTLLDKADEIAAGLGDHEPQQLREAFAAYAKLDAVADFDARLTAWQRNRI